MFGKNTYLLHQDSRASTTGTEILLHHPELLYPVPDPAVLYSNQELGHGHGHGLNVIVSEPSRTAKKDRHSKINTAQGPRDRRVRLSIGVARKFFDLQEMLGFDKPSKTLDWLLTKSKSAIKHMVQTKGSTKAVVSECEDNNSGSRKKEKSTATPANNSSKKKKRANKGAQHQEAISLAKESRAKARARARERTREKMCIKQQQQQQQQINGYDLIPIQYMNNQDYHQEDLIQESIVSKIRVVKHTTTTTTTTTNNNNNPSIFGFQTTYGMPSSSYSNAAAENWDISNYATQSSICAILDQHKFNHRCSNN